VGERAVELLERALVGARIGGGRRAMPGEIREYRFSSLSS